jgi:murein L,D-transpeptidase YcbB/YkuD
MIPIFDMRTAISKPSLPASVLLAGLLALVASFSARAQLDATGEAIRERVEQLRTAQTLVIEGATVMSTSLLPRIYEKRAFRAAWSDPKRTELLDVIRAMDGDGLLPGDYHLAELEQLQARLAAGADPVTAAALDVLATDAFILALYHLYFGKVDPVTLFPHWNFRRDPPNGIDAVTIVGDAIESGAIAATADRARPKHPLYQQGRKLLADYRAIQARGGWPTIPAGPTLKPGMTDPRVLILRERLAATGDLTDAPLDSDVYDTAVEAAVKRFQGRHFIIADGTVGPATLTALNVPVGARIEQIRANLERGRWVLREIAGEFVLVDVAGFQVTYSRDGKRIFEGRAQVGRPYRETPIFRSDIEYIVFNPTWTVPPGIMKNDVMPKIRRDPRYAEKNNMSWVGGQLVQKPGPNNALGQVKIMFPNPYLVYLHDTPSKSLFEKDDRTFSSGCIRVEGPLELARLLLDEPRWDDAAIRKIIDSRWTTTVTLRRKVPVLLLYWTVDFDDQGRPEFKRDSYGRDPPLVKALNGRFEVGRRLEV